MVTQGLRLESLCDASTNAASATDHEDVFVHALFIG
jgi:hypothetical protein